MKRLLLMLGCIFMLSNSAWSQGFTTNNTNGNLLDACGNNFIMKGMNVPLAWYVSNVNGSIAALKTNTKSNCLRIVVETGTSDNSWQTCVVNCINNKMIPMVELHDVTGSTDPARLKAMGDFWASKAAFFNNTNFNGVNIKKHILINLANEWGTWQTATNKNTVWRDAVINAIKPMRNAGITTTIVVDAVGYGQDIDDAYNIRTYAKDIQRADNTNLGGPSNSTEKSNLLFSIHMYCEWRKGGDNIAIVNTIKSSGIPIIVGEFGYQHATDGSCDIDEQLIINTCQTGGIGWLAWSQKGNGSPVEYLDLCSDWNCTQLSTWGNTVINGTNGTKTAVECSVFSSTSCGTNNPTPTVSITAPANNSSFCVGSAITINATASVSSGSVSKVDFYDGNTLLGTDNTSPYSYTFNNASAGAHTLRAIATSAANVASTAATATVTVNALPAIAPQVQVNGGTWTAQSSAQLCEGGSLNIGPHPYDVATGWTWTGPNNFMASVREIQFPAITVAQGGEYTVNYKDANGCTSTVKIPVSVNVNPVVTITAPANNSTITGSPANITITANVAGTGISNVQFYNGTTLLGSDATAPYSYIWNNVSNGTYTLNVKATTTANCTGTSMATVTVTPVTGHSEDLETSGISCFPNPFQETFTITAPEAFDYVIYDAAGVVIEKGHGNKQVTTGQQLQRGVYMVKITSSIGDHWIKVTK